MAIVLSFRYSFHRRVCRVPTSGIFPSRYPRHDSTTLADLGWCVLARIRPAQSAFQHLSPPVQLFAAPDLVAIETPCQPGSSFAAVPKSPRRGSHNLRCWTLALGWPLRLFANRMRNRPALARGLAQRRGGGAQWAPSFVRLLICGPCLHTYEQTTPPSKFGQGKKAARPARKGD